LKCNIGYTGKVLKSTSEISYLNTCDKMVTCNAINFYGLPDVLDNLVSCHKCLESTWIPFIGLLLDNTPNNYNITGISSFTLKSPEYLKVSSN